MKNNTIVRPDRRRLRLPDYDYSSPGAYFLTVVTSGRPCLFGEVVDSVMQTNAAGTMIEYWWARLESKFPWLSVDESIVMPNHLHGILFVGADPCVRPPVGQGAEPLPKVMQWFKTMTTNAYIQGVRTKGWEPFQARLWQRSYYERVVRNENELYEARRYIAGNPSKWMEDAENPANIRRSA